MKSSARVLASLPRFDCAIRWRIVGDLGVVRRRKDTRGWYIDLRPYGRIYRNRGIPIESKKTAMRILEQIRGELAAGQSIHRVLAAYLPERSKLNRFRSHLERWLEVKRRETEGGSLSPTYLRELERYGKEHGYFSFFDELSIYELSYARVEDFSLHLCDLGLSPKTRRNVLGALHVFLGWLRKRGELEQLPRSRSRGWTSTNLASSRSRTRIASWMRSPRSAGGSFSPSPTSGCARGRRARSTWPTTGTAG